MLAQGFANGFDNIDFMQTGINGLMGASTAAIGSGIGDRLAKPISGLTSKISSPVMRDAVQNGALMSSTNFIMSTTLSLASGESVGESFKQGGLGALSGLGMGLITGTVSGVQYAKKNNLNPWTGKANIEVTAKDLGVLGTINRIERGEKYPHDNDGTTFKNNRFYLPIKSENYYKEYVHPTPGVKGAGAQRIVIGKNGEMYYTPDHYKTFIRIIK